MGASEIASLFMLVTSVSPSLLSYPRVIKRPVSCGANVAELRRAELGGHRISVSGFIYAFLEGIHNFALRFSA